MIRSIMLLTALCACSGVPAEPFDGGSGDASSDAADAAEDHKIGAGNDASSDALAPTDAGASVPYCEQQDASSGPPVSCVGATNGKGEPLPSRWWCVRDSGTWPNGALGVDCVYEGDMDSISSFCCR